MNSEYEYLKDTILFRCIDDEPDSLLRSELIKFVHDMTEYSAPLLDKIVEGHPNFTLHSRLHSRNIVSLMGRLLHHWYAEVRGVEAALMIGAAYWHDIGMLNIDHGSYGFRKITPDNLQEQSEWYRFLDSDSIFLGYIDNEEIHEDTVRRFIRYTHGDRVSIHVEIFENHFGTFKIDGVNYKGIFRDVCRSHTRDHQWLLTQPNFKSKIQGVDTLFCALLLRVCDIMDFDSSRAPESYFAHQDSLNEFEHDFVARLEWRAHRVSRGFTLPDDSTNPHAESLGDGTEERRDKDFTVAFEAQPDSPEIEDVIRQRLLKIAEEFGASCALLRDQCRVELQSLPFPKNIDKSGIHPDGYLSGDYKFSLEKEQILELVSGKNLYQDNFVFIRELIQNAIDTCRVRMLYDEEPLPQVNIASWRNRLSGHLWISVDDIGMGMDLDVVENYFLNVGASYYSSIEFKQIIREISAGSNKHKAIRPVSRFGIGIVSCFLSSSRVEVFTQPLSRDGRVSEPVRLTLNGLTSSFTVRQGQDALDSDFPATMYPQDRDTENVQCKELEQARRGGTIVAVQVDPQSEEIGFDIWEKVHNYLLATPINVKVNGRSAGLQTAPFSSNLPLPASTFAVPSEWSVLLSNTLHLPRSKWFDIKYHRFDYSKYSVYQEYAGESLVVTIILDNSIRKFVSVLEEYGTFRIIRKEVRAKPKLAEMPKVAWTLEVGFSLSRDLPDLREIDGDEGQAIRELYSEFTDFKGRSIGSRDADWSLVEKFGEMYGIKSIELGPFDLASMFGEEVSRAVSSIANRPFGIIAHNGVIVPPAYVGGISDMYKITPVRGLSRTPSDQNDLEINSGDAENGDFVWSVYLLSDRYRPDVEMSRDKLRAFPLEVYGEALSSLWMALNDHRIEVVHPKTLVNHCTLISQSPVSMIELDRCESLKRVEWHQFRMYGISDRSGVTKLSYSISHIQKLNADGLSVVIGDSSNSFSACSGLRGAEGRHWQHSFFNYAWSYLAQRNLDLILASPDDLDRIELIDGQKGSIAQRIRTFGAGYKFIVAVPSGAITNEHQDVGPLLLSYLLPPLMCLKFTNVDETYDYRFGFNAGSRLIQTADKLTKSKMTDWHRSRLNVSVDHMARLSDSIEPTPNELEQISTRLLGTLLSLSDNSSESFVLADLNQIFPGFHMTLA